MVSITHVYIYVLKTEVRNESRIFDFYTISLSIIMIRRTVSSIKIETMNHAILTSTNHVVQFTYQACSLLFKWKKKTFKRSDDFVAFIFLHLSCYLLSTKSTRLSRPRLIEQVSYLEWIEVPPPSTKSTLPLNFVETVCFRHALILMHG